MSKIVIFGLADTAQLAEFYLRTDSPHEVVAFTVNGEYKDRDTFCDLPVVDFETVTEHYPPSEYKLFVPMTGKNRNKLRESVYLQGKEKGYEYISYISSHATVLTEDIGENCFILEDNTIQPFVKIGDNVVLWSGNHIGHHSEIHSHNFFTSHVVLSGHCVVESYCFFGVNATIRNAVTIATESFIAMSASITKDTEPSTKYVGTY